MSSGAAHKCTERRDIPGSVAFVPSVAGLIIAGEVIKRPDCGVQKIRSVYFEMCMVSEWYGTHLFCGKYLESDGGITFWILWNCYREKVKII